MQWISVSDKKPNPFEKVLLWYYGYQIGYFIQDSSWAMFIDDAVVTAKPTHWAPLPDAPQGEKPKPVDPTWNV